jgi:hypothetical protein
LWWEWAQDYFQLVEDNGQGWAADVIEAAAGIYSNARMAGKTLETNNEVILALSSFQCKISNSLVCFSSYSESREIIAFITLVLTTFVLSRRQGLKQVYDS